MQNWLLPEDHMQSRGHVANVLYIHVNLCISLAAVLICRRAHDAVLQMSFVFACLFVCRLFARSVGFVPRTPYGTVSVVKSWTGLVLRCASHGWPSRTHGCPHISVSRTQLDSTPKPPWLIWCLVHLLLHPEEETPDQIRLVFYCSMSSRVLRFSYVSPPLFDFQPIENVWKEGKGH